MGGTGWPACLESQAGSKSATGDSSRVHPSSFEISTFPSSVGGTGTHSAIPDLGEGGRVSQSRSGLLSTPEDGKQALFEVT